MLANLIPAVLLLIESIVMIAGDFNFHIQLPQNPSTRRFSELLDDENLNSWSPLVATHHGGHCLDMVATTFWYPTFDSCQVTENGLSDHYYLV